MQEQGTGLAGPFTTPGRAPDGTSWDFATAARHVLAHLRDRLGFSLWMLTRAEGDDWIVLDALGAGYDVKAGDVLRWSDSLCRHMVAGDGPRMAPRIREIPAYRAAGIIRTMPVAAYAGVPIRRPDGSLFGTLCALDPVPQPQAVATQLPLVELLSGLLASVLAYELGTLGEARRAERAAFEAETDPLTRLPDRRAWQRLLEAEEIRCRRYGDPAGVVIVDVDEMKAVNDSGGHRAGDELLMATARVLRKAGRGGDLIARIGGDEFAVLAVESDAATTAALAHRLHRALADGHISASLGYSTRDPATGLAATWMQADRALHEARRDRFGPPILRVAPITS
jgi:diguanylate cyclase (GGDEF)-like protein